MDPERFDRFNQNVGASSRRRSVVSLLAAAALGVAALGQSAQPAAAITTKQCQCRQLAARITGNKDGVCYLSPKVTDDATYAECVRDADRCRDLALTCKPTVAEKCRQDFAEKWIFS